MGACFLIFGIVLIQFIQRLQPFQFILFLLQVVILGDQFIYLCLQFLVFLPHLLQRVEIVAYVAQPGADLIDAFLHGNDCYAGNPFERPLRFVGKYGKHHQQDAEQRKP